MMLAGTVTQIPAEVPYRVVVEPKDGGAALPSRVMNLTHLPVVRRQGLANCGAFAPSYYYKTHQEARERGWVMPDPEVNPERVMSPGFTYPLVNGGQDGGASVLQTLSVIVRHGIATWEVMPETADYHTYPGEVAWRNAIPHRAAGVVTIDTTTPGGITALKQHLASGDLAVVTIRLHHDTHDQYGTPGWGVGIDNEVIFANGSQPWLQHAFTVVGYDDGRSWMQDGEVRHGAFALVNSWGQDWGVSLPEREGGGFMWVSYDYMMNLRGGGPHAHALDDLVGYEPMEFAVVDYFVASRSTLSQGVYAGSPENPLSPIIASVLQAGGDRPFSGRVVLDVTELMPLEAISYTFSCYDVSSEFGVPVGSVTGGIQRFHIEKADGTIIRSPETPEGPASILAGRVTTASAGPFHQDSFGLEGLDHSAVTLALGDWNRDGRVDVAVGGGPIFGVNSLNIYWNTGPDVGGRLYPTASDLPGFNQTEALWADMDRSGLVDLIVMGWLDGAPAPGRIYRNLGGGDFEEMPVALPALTAASLAVADYTNNGALDLAFTGRDETGNHVARIWYNPGDGALTESGIALAAGDRENVSWVDIDNDGWLDLVVGNRLYRNTRDGGFSLDGMPGGESSQVTHAWGDMNGNGLMDVVTTGYGTPPDGWSAERLTRLFRNEGNFTFTELAHDMPHLANGRHIWGDIDNDGRLDLIITGYKVDDWSATATHVFRQTTNGTLKDIGANVVGTAIGSVALADMNGNGFLDLLVSGHHDLDPEIGRFRGRTEFYRNVLASDIDPDMPNAPPSMPGNLRESRSPEEQLIQLTWNDSHDRETPAAALRYRVRVGSYPGGWDVATPVPLGHPHRMGDSPGRLLKDLPPGRYYWSVQAVDGGQRHSAWSQEKSFLVGLSGVLGDDPNNDGILDAADLVGLTPGDLFLRNHVVRQILEAAGTPAMREVATVVVGSNGGVLSAPVEGLQVSVPPGAFSTMATLRLSVAASPGELGPDVEPYMWRVDGLPIDHTEPLSVRLRDWRSNKEGTPFVAIGMEGFSPSLGRMTTGYTKVEAQVVGEGWLQFEVDALTALNEGEKQELRASTEPSIRDYEYWFIIHLVAESQWGYRGGNFNLVGPLNIKDELPHIAADLEEQLAYYRKIGFDTSRRDWAGHPVKVTIRNLGRGGNGEPVSGYMVSALNYNRLSIEMNSIGITNRSRARATAAHELFHVMQGLYDSRNRVSRATTSPNLWLDEATATYFESHFSAAPDTPADLTNAYQNMIPRGIQQGYAFSSNTRQNYGYAMALLMHFLVKRNNNDPALIHDIYSRIRNGSDGLTALRDAVAGIPLQWVQEFYEKVVQEDILSGILSVPVLQADFMTPGRSRTLLTESSRAQVFPSSETPPLGATFTMLRLDPAMTTPPTGADRVGVMLDAPTIGDLGLSVVTMRRENNQFVYDSWGVATSVAGAQRLRLDLPDAAGRLPLGIRILPVITNSNIRGTNTPPLESTLHFGIYQDYVDRTIQNHQTTFNGVFHDGEYLNWPVFRATGRFTAYDVTALEENYLQTSGTTTVPTIRTRLWGDPDPIGLLLSIQPTTTNFSGFVRGMPVSVTYTGGLEYQVSKVVYVAEGTTLSSSVVETTPWSSSNTFSLATDPDEKISDFAVRFRYRYRVSGENEDRTRVGSAFAFYVFRP